MSTYRDQDLERSHCLRMNCISELKVIRPSVIYTSFDIRTMILVWTRMNEEIRRVYEFEFSSFLFFLVNLSVFLIF